MRYDGFFLRCNRYLRAWMVAFGLVPVLATIFMHNLGDLSNFIGDETMWLPVSNKLFRLYVIQHDFSDPAWHHDYSTFGSWHPQVGKYVIGVGTYLGGYPAEPYKPYYYNWRHDLAWNMAHGGVPPATLVLTGRIPVAIMGVTACMVFYWLATLLMGPWTGLLAVAILLASRLIIDASRVVMIDTPALAFGLMTLVGMVYVLRALRHHELREAQTYAVPTGIAGGLAIGTKLNALLVLVVCIVMLVGEAIVQLRVRPKTARAALLACAIINAGAWLIFYLSNPFLYGNVIAGSRHLLEMGSLVATIPFDQLKTRSEQVRAIWDHMLIYAPLARLGLRYDRWLILLGSTLLGAVTLRNFEYLRMHQLDLLIVWTVISYLGITLWLPHPWARYYLPLQPCNALLEAIAVTWLLRGLWKLIDMQWHLAQAGPQA